MSARGAVAIVSAMAEELAPLARRLARPRRARVRGLAVRHGELCGRQVCLAVAGEGGRLAAAALERLLSEVRLEALLGIGVAGGLTADLAAGDRVASRRVVSAGAAILEPPEWEWSERLARMEGLRGGTVVTVNDIAHRPADKRRLAVRLQLEECAVIDLESAAWAAAAAGRGLPWLVLRSVSDALDEELPLDFNRFRRADGSVSRARVAARALLRPKLIGELDRLRRRVDESATALADATEGLLGC